ncbi:hypothetical protein HK405_015805, partial [Cladochytrium tenue]
KAVVRGEQLEAVADAPVRGSLEDDYLAIEPWFDEREPCFVLFRLDERLQTTSGRAAGGGFGFLLIMYVPEVAKVREKMLYASTRGTLTKELGDSNFIDTLHASSKAEVSLAGYKKHLAHKAADAPLTERELERLQTNLAETGIDIGTTTRRAFAASSSSVGLPVSDEAAAALRGLRDGDHNAVLLTVDASRETVDVVSAQTVSTTDALVAGGTVPATEPSFVVLRHSSGS